MSNKRLSRELELNLLKKLSTDDDFRARFEKSPAEALKEIGASEEDISTLDSANLKPGKLAGKAAIGDAYNKLASTDVNEHICLIAPLLRLD